MAVGERGNSNRESVWRLNVGTGCLSAGRRARLDLVVVLGLSDAVPISIDEAIIQVRTLIANGDNDGLIGLIETLDAYPLRTLVDMRGMIAFMFEAQNRGMVEVVVERFANAAPADIGVQLLRVETFIKLGRPKVAAKLMEDLRPLTYDDYMRTGATWRQLGSQLKAAAAYLTAVSLAPEDLNCRRALIESYIWGRQLVPARQALTELVPRLPDQGHWWAFVADQASLLRDKRLFRHAADRTEPLLGATDANSRILLARAHGRFRQRGEMIRLLAKLDIAALQHDYLLKSVFDIAEQHKLTDIQLAAATEIVRRGTPNLALLDECRVIVDTHRSLATRLFAG